MASTGFQKRFWFLAAAATIALLGLLTHAQMTFAAGNSGGTAPAPGAKTPAANAPRAKTPTTKPRKAPRHGRRIVVLADARCVPTQDCSTNPHQVSVRGYLLLSGRGLQAGLAVAFPHSRNATIASDSPLTRIYTSPYGPAVHLPNGAHSGRIQVIIGGGRRSNAAGPITVVAYALHPPRPKTPPPPPAPTTAPSGSAFEGQGMWIWYLEKSAGGSLPALIAQAHSAGVTTVFVKSSDGSSNYWSQFSPELVATLHANGLKVCAWQFVYGSNPVGEAELGARAAQTGADCLVIDAEGEYEGRYGSAQKYMETLRAKIGPTYPVGLASFPYVNYHESFPYSVFLGPNGAQFNAPQMYWKDIGVSVASVYASTFEQNLIYQRPIAPLGQTYENPSNAELVAFRSLAAAYGAKGESWWDWQETTTSGWAALAEPLNATLTVPSPEGTSPLLSEGEKGDQVLWMQEHLATAVPTQATSGIFDATTKANLEAFQTAHGIPATGETDPNTWAALLALAPVAVNWTASGPQG